MVLNIYYKVWNSISSKVKKNEVNPISSSGDIKKNQMGRADSLSIQNQYIWKQGQQLAIGAEH